MLTPSEQHAAARCQPLSHWVKDPQHDRIKVGDVVIATFRGRPDQRFVILADTGTGMFMVRRPDGSESPMCPSTILAVAQRIQH